ncbi:MAG: hypothetical protein QXW80_05665 [Candidatus Micrarchaeia archaeon]
MFLRITRVRRGTSVLEYASIAERKIERGKQKKVTVKYLGPIRSKEDLNRHKGVAEEFRERMKKFSIGELKVGSALSFGTFYASRMMMDGNGISSVLKEYTGKYSEILSFMIVSRLFRPSSDLDLLA